MINTHKFNKYIQKMIIGKITKYSYKMNIKKGHTLCINYFYWWYKESYNFKTIGILVRKKRKFEFNVLRLTLFYISKNIRVNQVYLNTSPFLTLIKRRRSKRKKLIKTLYLL